MPLTGLEAVFQNDLQREQTFFKDCLQKPFLQGKTAIDLNCRFLLLFRSLGLRFLQFKSPLVLSPLSNVRRFLLRLI